MRPVAACLLIVLALALPPVHAAGIDQCVNDTNARQFCVAIVSPDPRVPSPTIYVFISGSECLSAPTNAQCHQNVFRESNNCPGLQRFAISGATNCAADTKLLI